MYAYVTSVAEVRQVILELSLPHSYLKRSIDTSRVRVTLVKSEQSTLKGDGILHEVWPRLDSCKLLTGLCSRTKPSCLRKEGKDTSSHYRRRLSVFVYSVEPYCTVYDRTPTETNCPGTFSVFSGSRSDHTVTTLFISTKIILSISLFSVGTKSLSFSIPLY